MWWSNTELRKVTKESIKDVIKNTKLHEKTTATPMQIPCNTPPSLYHSPSEGLCRTRGGSMDSNFSAEFNFNSLPTTDIFGNPVMAPPIMPAFAPFPGFTTPFEVDIKTEKQFFINDIEARRDSTITTSYFQPLPGSPDQSIPENWVQKDYFEHRHDNFMDEPEVGAPELENTMLPMQHEATVEESNHYLLNYFCENVLPLIFPTRAMREDCPSLSEVIVPSLQSNKAYYHCCLSIAGLHLKTAQGVQGDKLEADITSHMVTTINEICQTLKTDCNHEQVLDAALAMIFLRCLVGGVADQVSEVSWQSHFAIAAEVIERLELSTKALHSAEQPSLSMTIASWVDILGSTMKRKTPLFANLYREKNISKQSLGLADLIGCDDQIMFLISEIACLEALKADGMLDDIQLCVHISVLGNHISAAEAAAPEPANTFLATGAIDADRLRANMTAVFRIAARIYLCSLLPDFEPEKPGVQHLLAQFDAAMAFIPAGPQGFDRALVWPLLMAGSVALPGSVFRATLEERAAQMGGVAAIGSFARARELLDEVWRVNDEAAVRGERRGLHWRDVMQERGWDFLLI
jgi:C6 transcription factor Pro1